MRTEYYRLRVNYDGQLELCDPRELDNLGTLLLWWGNKTLGDPKERALLADTSTLHAALVSLLAEFDEAKAAQFTGRCKLEDALDLIAALSNWVVILPVYGYEHSGITISTKPFGDRFDSGLAGFIYVTKEYAITERCGAPGDGWSVAIAQLEAEVKTYASYLEGDVYQCDVETLEYDFEIPSEPVEASNASLPWADGESTYGLIGEASVLALVGPRHAGWDQAVKAALAKLGSWQLVTTRVDDGISVLDEHIKTSDPADFPLDGTL